MYSKLGDEVKRVRDLSGAAKIALAVDMTEASVQVCMGSLREKNPEISECELIEKTRNILLFEKKLFGKKQVAPLIR